MKKLYVNGRILGAKLSGVPRYSRELLRELDALLASTKPAIKAEILLPRNVKSDLTLRFFSTRSVGRLTGHAWEQFELPFYARGGLLFAPSGTAPLLHSNVVVTLHDAIVFAAPEGFNLLYRTWYRLMERALCHTATHVVTVSRFSQNELSRWCGIQPERISVIYPGCQHLHSLKPNSSIVERLGLKKFGYVLAVGSSSPNKNFKGIIDAIDSMREDISVVLVGQTGMQVGNHGSRQSMLSHVRVIHAGHVTDAELRSLYEHAGCFLFPSFYEGFGIPPLEALSFGCPTVVSQAASLPEICGAVALICNPHDPKDIATKAMEAIELHTQPENSQRFVEFAAQYSYERAAHELWNVLIPFLF